MTTPLIRSTMQWMVDADIDPTELQWFDISGAIDGQTITQDWLRDYRPPFEKSIVVWQGRSKTHEVYDFFMSVVGSDPEEGVIVAAYKGPHGVRPRKVPLLVYVVDDGQIRYGALDDDDPIAEDEANMVLAVLATWYRSLGQGCESHRPVVRQTFTNRRKVAQGKTPTYEWTTVYIAPAKPRSESKGGTHASPRQHDRRGHLRRLRSGKNVWVKSCTVGDASKGAVWHDYAIKEVAA